MDRPTGRVIRRYERDKPGELVHVDIKKLGRARWRRLAHPRPRPAPEPQAGPGWDFIHSAVDDHRLAYSEIASLLTSLPATASQSPASTDNAKAYPVPG
jgi:hypothetical protein